MVKVEDIYACMLGEMTEPLDGVSNEFAPGSYCDRLYNQASAARAQLCNRLNVDDDPELEVIFDSFCDICAHLCKKMFEYGAALETH